jgi:AraC-like DNA-binding protein
VTEPWLDELADPRTPINLYVGRADLPREVLGPRRVDRHILLLLLGGNYEGEVDGCPVRVGPGDLLWLRPEVPHRLVAIGRLRKYFLRLATPAQVPAGPLFRHLGDEAAVWCGALLAECNQNDGERERRIRALLMLLFSAWNRAGAVPVGGLHPERRGRLLQLFHARPDQRWTRDGLGTVLGISGLHLARQVRRTFGVSLRTWLVEERIRAAARVLRDGNEPIGVVARRFGYSDIFLFSRQFRRVMGSSPRQWRG